MLTIPSLFVTSTSTNATPTTGVLHYLISEICTDFDHDGGQTSFASGQAVLTGVPFALLFVSGGTTLSTSIVTESGFFMPMDVVTGTFDTVNSTGWVEMTGTATVPFMAQVDTINQMTLLVGTVTLTPLTSGPSGLSGLIRGTFSAIGASTDTFVSAAPRQVTLTAGGCEA